MVNENEYKILDEYLELSLFADIELGLAAARKINEAMDQVMERIEELLSPVTWSLILHDTKRDVLYFKQAKGRNAERLEGKDIPKKKGVASWVFQNKKNILVKDVTKEARYHHYIEKLTGFKIQSVLGVPVKVNDNVIGVIELLNKAGKERYKPEDLRVLQTVVDYAALAVEKIYYLGAVENMARIEPLTGLLNPKNFIQTVERESERCKRYGRPLTLMTVAVKNLEDIHKKHGADMRDQVLKNIAENLKNNVRKIDTLSRLKDNKFAVLMPNTKKHEAENVRQRILKLSKKGIKKKKKGEVNYSLEIDMRSVGPKDVSELKEVVSDESKAKGA